MLKNRSKLLLFSTFLFIIILSAFFRIQNLHLIEFKADEGINLFLATRPIFGHPFPPIGLISSAGIPNPPFFSYLMFPIVYLTLDPKGISFIIGSINSIVIGLFFIFVYRFYGFSTAFFSATLLALSPWSILFSRKIWPPDFILPFVVAILFTLHKIVKDKKEFYWLPYTALSLLLIQLYHPTIFFVILATLFLLIQKTKPDFRAVAIGTLLGLMPLIPYLAYEAQNSCRECSAFIEVKEKLAVNPSAEMFLRPMQIIGQGNFRFIMGDDISTLARNYPLVYELRKLLYIPYLLLPLGILIFWKRYAGFRFLVYSTILLPILYFFIRLEPFMHYFAVIIPILFLFTGVGLAKLFSIKTVGIKHFTGILFVVLVTVYFSFNNSFFDLLGKQGNLSGDYGSSFANTEKSVKDRLRMYKNDKHYDEMVLANYVQRANFAESATLASAVYDQEQTEKNIDKLEQRLKEVPEDRRIENELLAYYTTLPKTPETMKNLREKTINNQYYHHIYEEIYRQYLAKNLKKAYRGPNFSFEYPEHWSQTELSSGEVILMVDEFTILINKDRSVEFSQSQVNHPNNEKLNAVIKEIERVANSIREESI